MLAGAVRGKKGSFGGESRVRLSIVGIGRLTKLVSLLNLQLNSLENIDITFCCWNPRKKGCHSFLILAQVCKHNKPVCLLKNRNKSR